MLRGLASDLRREEGSLAPIHSAAYEASRWGQRNPRAFARKQILVGKAAEEASAALAEGDHLMAALANHLQARQANRDLGPPPGV